MTFIKFTLATGGETWVNIDKIVRLEKVEDRTLVAIDTGSMIVLEPIDEIFERK